MKSPAFVYALFFYLFAAVGAFAQTPTATPSPTPFVPVVVTSGNGFTLTWDANRTTDNVTKYILGYGPTPRTGPSFVYPTSVDITTGVFYKFPPQSVGKLYMAVRAVNTRGAGAYSVEAVADTQQGVPGPVQLPRITVDALAKNLAPGVYVMTVRADSKKYKPGKGSIQIVRQR